MYIITNFEIVFRETYVKNDWNIPPEWPVLKMIETPHLSDMC